MFKCHICPYTTSRKFNLKTHHNKKVKCVPILNPKGAHTMQNDPFPDKVQNNVQTNSEPNQLKCKGCDKCFQTKQNLNKHLFRCKGRNDPKECQTCYKVFSTSKARAKHNKLVFCKRPDDLPETFAEKLLRLEKEIENVKQENEMLKSQSLTLGEKTTINKLQNQIEIRDTEIENLIELAFEEEKIPKKPGKIPKPKPKRGFVTQSIRTQVAASQKWCCRICMEMLTGIFHIDHTVPLSRGGEDELKNITALCVQCHAVKTQNEWKL